MDIDKILLLMYKEVMRFKAPVVEMVEITRNDPYRIVVATMLSARTKDETTVKACKRLFEVAPTPEKLAELELHTIEKLIFPVGFYKTKARRLKQLPAYIKGGIPTTLEGLMSIHGIGRKTANIVLNSAFGKDAIGVDTHVHRISNRIGIVNSSTPVETERMLKKVVPKRWWSKINFIMVSYGQNVCRPISPHCSKCVIKDYCQRNGVEMSR